MLAEVCKNVVMARDFKINTATEEATASLVLNLVSVLASFFVISHQISQMMMILKSFQLKPL